MYPSEETALEELRKKWKLRSFMDVIRTLAIAHPKTGKLVEAFYLPRESK